MIAGYEVWKSGTEPLYFFLASTTDRVTPMPGLSPTVTLAKNGASPAAAAGAVSEVGSGWYKVASNASDKEMDGPLLLLAAATGAAGSALYRVTSLQHTAAFGDLSMKLAADGLDAVVLEALTGAIAAINARQGLQLILAATAGGRDGAGTGTTTVTSPGGTERAEYDTPGDGNRTVNSTSLTA